LLDLAARRNAHRIDQVNLRLVDAFRAERASTSEAKTVHNDTVTIKQLVNFALRRRLIKEDTLQWLKLEIPKRTPQPFWSREEVNKIIAEARPPYQDSFVLLADTGMRIGELKWLTWDDIDLLKSLIHIRSKDGWRPKSGDQRAVPMSARVKKLLKSLPKNRRWAFTARQTPRHPEPGRQISERRALEHLKRVLKRLGLRGHLHTFRHSFISFAAYNGTSERVLRRWIGHVDPDILEWYFHLADRQSVEAMDRLMGSEAGPATDRIDSSNSAQSQHSKENDNGSTSAK
jgi:integrase